MEEVNFQEMKQNSQAKHIKIIHIFDFFFLLFSIFFNKHQQVAGLRKIIILISFLSQILTWSKHISF